MIRSFKKAREGALNLIVLLVSSVSILLILEAAIRLLDLFPRARDAARAAVAPEPETDRPVTKLRLHPLLGWTHHPGAAATGALSYNVFGFLSQFEDYRSFTGEEFVLGVFGGSVARGVAIHGEDTLVEVIERERPELRGRVRVANLATGGYKQPQQLAALTQMLLLGIPLDVVVNVDGYNEVALGAQDAGMGSHPYFPFRSYWATTFDFVSGAPTESQIELTAEVLRHKRRSRDLRAFLGRHPGWARFEAVRVLVGSFSMSADARAAVAEEKLGQLPRGEDALATATLPAPCLGQELACWELIADIWMRGSLYMSSMASEAGMIYIHALQPNQYVEGSKALTEEELSVAYRPELLSSRAARLGYRHLQQRGAELRERGIRFQDLTMIFQDEREDIYRDICCHYNKSGYRIVAEAVAGEIVAALSEEPQPLRD